MGLKKAGHDRAHMHTHRVDLDTEWSKSDRKREILYNIPYMGNLKRNDTNEFISEAETDSQT